MHDEKQIQGMVDFIERDAHEKARELEDESNAQYNSEKANHVEAEKKKVLTAFEKEKKQVEVNRRVGAAQHSQEQRMRVLDTRREMLDQLQDSVKNQVIALTKNQGKYGPLLQELLNQCCVAVRADSTICVCQRDVGLVKPMLKKTEAEVKRITGKTVTLTLDTTTYLDEATAWGGVSILGFNKMITCENTLANRATNVFNEQLPTVRHLMFHEQAKF